MTAEEQRLNIQREIPLAQPSAQAVQEMTVRRMDWQRLRKDVASVRDAREATLAWDAFLWFTGSSVACLVTVLVLPDQGDSYLKPGLWAAASSTFVLGLLSLFFHSQMTHGKERAAQRICDDMDEIEKDLFQSTDPSSKPMLQERRERLDRIIQSLTKQEEQDASP